MDTNRQQQSCLSQPAIERSRGTSISEQEALVIDYESKKALLRREGQLCVLAGFWVYYDNDEQIEEPTTMVSHIEKLTGAAETFAFLRPLWKTERKVRISNETHILEKYVMLVEATGDPGPHGHEYEWVNLQEADVYHLFEDAAKAIREEIQWTLNGSRSAKLPAWQRPGWLRFAVSWVEDVLNKHRNVRPTKPVSVQRSSANGVILRAETENGRFFLKCTSPLANDAAYTDALSNIVPRFVARPVAVDRDKQMMVTADYGEILTVGRLSIEEEKEISKDYLRLQKGTICRTDELIDAGFPDLRPMKLMEHIDKLPLDSMFQAIGDTEEYAPYVKFFCENRERLKNDLKALNESGIPATVTHNDLGVTNIYKPVHADCYMFFDWVEGFVGHPFTSSRHGIETDTFLEEWNRDCDLGIEALKRLLDLGYIFHCLAILILKLREANASEPYHAEKCIEGASLTLAELKYGLL